MCRVYSTRQGNHGMWLWKAVSKVDQEDALNQITMFTGSTFLEVSRQVQDSEASAIVVDTLTRRLMLDCIGSAGQKKTGLAQKFRKIFFLIGVPNRQYIISCFHTSRSYSQCGSMACSFGDTTKNVTGKLFRLFKWKVLRCIIHPHWYIHNDDIHKALKVASVDEGTVIRHEASTWVHEYLALTLQILDNADLVRRFNTDKPFEPV